jgi:glycosyltransferase involved in cell wall biosynthesis
VTVLALALSRLSGLANLAHRSAAAAIRAGDRHRDARQWARAACAYQRALQLDPSLSGIWVQYGHALKEQGALEAAETAYRKAMACGLDDADVHLQLGHVLKLRNQRPDAVRAYSEAFRREPTHPDVLTELRHMGWTRQDFRRAFAATEHARLPKGATATARDVRASTDAQVPTIAFDISDLVHYLGVSRHPTGIQRVQLNVISALLERPVPGIEVMLVSYTDASGTWVEIEPSLFKDLAAAMSASGSPEDPGWRRLVSTVTTHIVVGEDAAMPAGTRLVNLGSSWAFANYFLALRRARGHRGVIYVPFIHDCIPILSPQSFVPELQRDFRDWMVSVLAHADGLLANSKATARDVRRVAHGLGHPDRTAAPIPLDATPMPMPTPRVHEAPSDECLPFLREAGLEAGTYVLFVATIEPRKNHLLAFDAWDKMIASRGAQRVPQLVCVGGRGWRNEPIMRRLEESGALKRKVSLLRGVSDEQLDQLYRGCRFTIYPSQYEGWGLPVTESLSKGRVPLVSRASALPEAGGELAEYFDLANPVEFRSKLE